MALGKTSIIAAPRRSQILALESSLTTVVSGLDRLFERAEARLVRFESDEQYLSHFQPDPAAVRFHQALLHVIRSTPFPMSAPAGFALLRLLDAVHVVLGDLDTRTNPYAGSNREAALLVSHVFASVHPDPDWWLYRFQEMAAEEFDGALVRRWYEAFRRHGDVIGYRPELADEPS